MAITRNYNQELSRLGEAKVPHASSLCHPELLARRRGSGTAEETEQERDGESKGMPRAGWGKRREG